MEFSTISMCFHAGASINIQYAFVHGDMVWQQINAKLVIYKPVPSSRWLGTSENKRASERKNKGGLRRERKGENL